MESRIASGMCTGTCSLHISHKETELHGLPFSLCLWGEGGTMAGLGLGLGSGLGLGLGLMLGLGLGLVLRLW